MHAILMLALLITLPLVTVAEAPPSSWLRAWPDTDFTNASVAFEEILSGGPPKDGIPSIDDPSFGAANEVSLAPREPVVGLILTGDARAYPLRILIWHEIINDVVGGVPVAVTYCPLCNTSIVFDRRAAGQTLEFGTTGKLRNSDLVMYDRETESWWQQFLGEAIVGQLTGTRLEMVPSRLESFASFRARAYGRNPYAGYDSSARPFLYRGELPSEVAPLARIVRVGEQAWSLDLLRKAGTLEAGDLRLTWEPGQVSALDAATITDGREVGNVIVQRKTAEGWEDVVYSVDFAFAFRAFYPDAPIHTTWPAG